MVQKLLLLPELSDFVTTDTNTGPVKMASIPTVNKKSSYLNEYNLLSNEVTSSRISVSGLTASWTHVNL